MLMDLSALVVVHTSYRLQSISKGKGDNESLLLKMLNETGLRGMNARGQGDGKEQRK